MDPHDITALSLGAASLVFLVFAWMIGVGGHAWLITNYRRHPERYPDVAGLTRWMGFTLGFAGLSMGLCALMYAMQEIDKRDLKVWTVTSGVILVSLACLGLARYRRMPKDKRGS